MKVRAEVSADREKPVSWGQESPHTRTSVTVKLTIEDTRQGDAVVGSINAAMDHAHKIAVESVRAGA